MVTVLVFRQMRSLGALLPPDFRRFDYARGREPTSLFQMRN
jgi:hypothetical protein